jgi:hypothetical protein
MYKQNLHPVMRVFLLLTAIAGSVACSVALLYGSRANSVFGTVSQSTSIAWLMSAVALFVIVVFMFRLTNMNWFWSVLSGALAIVIYSILVSSIFRILDIFMEGWLWG